MLTWLRRLFVQGPAIREVRERLSNVEADLEWLALELKRLRGRVTGGIRHQGGTTNGDIPAHIQGGQRAWLERLDPVSRKIHLHRLAGSK
jgi:hypothetical protein